jgi:predicted permease
MIFRRIWYLLNRARLERELEEEMTAHRAQMPAGQQSHFGNSLWIREQARDAWGWAWLDALGQDLRFGSRILLRAPGFTAAIVAVMALGIGVALTAFQVFNTLVLRPLPVRAPENLYALHLRGPDNYSDVVSYPLYGFIRDSNRPLAAVMAQMSGEVQVGRSGELRAAARFVSSNYLAELGAGPARGRLFDPASDGTPGAPAVVVLSYAFWQRRYGSDPQAIGRTIYVDGRPASIAGVAAPGFSGIDWSTVDLWIPIEQHAWFFPGSDLFRNVSRRPLRIYARLRPQVTAPAAEESLRPLAAGFRSIYPGSIGSRQSLECVPAGHALNLRASDIDPAVFFGALVLLVLAVSLSNAGALQLSRSLARSREIWIRSSVGAGRFRLVRQLAAEAALIAALASALGLLLSYFGASAILLSLETPLKAAGAYDWRTVAATLALALCAAALSGLAPAVHILRPGHRTGRLRGALIAIQVAATCVLLIAAGLYARGLQRVLSAPLGFEYRDVVAVDPGFGSRGYSPERARLALAGLKRRVEAAPGILSASVCSVPPLGNEFWMEGVETPSGHVNAHVNAVQPEYFETMRTAILRGRTFRPGERKAAIVGDSLARRAWPGENPVGKLIANGRLIVGVAASARTMALRDGEATEMYFPFGDGDPGISGAVLLIRTAGDPHAYLPAIRAAVTSPNDPPPQIDLLSDRFEQVTSGTRKGATAIGLTGLLALVIAATGIAGLLFYAVSQRTREIGIRLAVGATGRDIATAVLSKAARPVAAGLLLGASAGYAVAILMERQIYGIGRLDPPAYAAALCVLLAAAALAAAFPVWRALHVNAVDALRHE